MPPVVFVMLGAGALLHALWNVLLKRSEDPLATATRAMGFGLLVVTPLAAIAWWLTGRPTLSLPALGLAAGSAVVELLYFIFLSAAYRRGDLSTVYPIARGTAPLIAVAIGLLILGERLHQGAYLGVALLVAGIWLVRRPAGTGPAVRFAAFTGVTIAAYSAIDRLGVQAASALAYGWVLWVLTFVLLQAWVRVTPRIARRDATSAGARAPGRDAVLGIAMLGAWLLALGALSLAPVAAVVPVRESAIVLVTGWGVVRMGEREGAAGRVLGALAIAAGVVVMAVA